MWDDTGGDMNPIRRSDIAIIRAGVFIWINGTQPVMGLPGNDPFIDGPEVPPNSSFPFTRLACATTSDQSTTFLYHQINGTTIAEEQWDSISSTWLAPEYLTF